MTDGRLISAILFQGFKSRLFGGIKLGLGNIYFSLRRVFFLRLYVKLGPLCTLEALASEQDTVSGGHFSIAVISTSSKDLFYQNK